MKCTKPLPCHYDLPRRKRRKRRGGRKVAAAKARAYRRRCARRYAFYLSSRSVRVISERGGMFRVETVRLSEAERQEAARDAGYRDDADRAADRSPLCSESPFTLRSRWATTRQGETVKITLRPTETEVYNDRQIKRHAADLYRNK